MLVVFLGTLFKSPNSWWRVAMCMAVLLVVASGQPVVPAERTVLDKTPTPCKESYDSALVAEAAEKHLKDVACAKSSPRMLLMLGGSGAGKGTFLRHLAPFGFDRADFVAHGLDEYLQYLPEYEKTIADPANVYKDAADACYGPGAIPIAQAAQKLLIERKCNLIYEETGKNLDRILKRVLPPFAEAHYSITVVLVDSLPSIAKSRAYERFQKEGRYAPDDYIEGSFANVFENYGKLRLHEFVSESVYCDNSCLNLPGGGAGKKPGECMRCWFDTNKTFEWSDFDPLIPTASLRQLPIEYLPRDPTSRSEL